MLVCRMYLNIIISPLVINFSHFITFSLFRKTAFDGCKITNFARFYLLPYTCNVKTKHVLRFL